MPGQKAASQEFGCTGRPISVSHKAAGSLAAPSLPQMTSRPRSSGVSAANGMVPPSRNTNADERGSGRRMKIGCSIVFHASRCLNLATARARSAAM